MHQRGLCLAQEVSQYPRGDHSHLRGAVGSDTRSGLFYLADIHVLYTEIHHVRHQLNAAVPYRLYHRNGAAADRRDHLLLHPARLTAGRHDYEGSGRQIPRAGQKESQELPF